ncbi:MAG: MFS transporter [Bacteroidia bacterium]|nr:MFS transporter [Bacteroidia bacterium]
MRTLYNGYIGMFQGLSREIWILSFVTFINRAGAMVIPFLSLYLVSEKDLSLPEVGWIMSCYGLGSLFGNYTGGILTDRIGFYKTIVFSLFFGGIAFMLFQYLNTFVSLCIGMFILMFLVDIYRPGIYVAADIYGDEGKLTTRNIGLIRLAINLGYSIGPVIGGFLIAKVSYNSIFWFDGLTCVIASLLLFFLLKPKKTIKEDAKPLVVKEGPPPMKNKLYLVLMLIMIINSIAFIQYFSTVPLYYKNYHGLNESTIGWILFINGALIVLFEMPLIAWLEHLKITKTMATFLGIAFLAISFIVLNVSDGFYILIIGIVFMTLGEMIGSPFSNSLALSMAPKGRKGSYMAIYSMTFSISQIIGHNAGMNAIHEFGYDKTWVFLFIILAIAGIITLYLYSAFKTSNVLKNY